LQVQDGSVHQEPGRGGRVVHPCLHFHQVPHYAEIVTALGVDEFHPVRQASHGRKDQLHEELVTHPRALDGLDHPRGEFLTSRRGQLVYALVRPAVLLDILAADEAILLEPFQCDVDLPDVG
jgi:hypothetical protein